MMTQKQITAALILLTGVAAQAGDSSRRPTTAFFQPRVVAVVAPNQSYLANTRIGTETDEAKNKEIQGTIYGEKLSKKLSSEYQDLNRDYLMKQNYGLVGPGSQTLQDKKNSEFGKYILRNILNYQLDDGLHKAEKKSPEVRQMTSAARSLDKVAHASADFHLNDNLKFGTKTNLPMQRARIWMKSSLFDANLDGQVGSGVGVDPFQTSQLNDKLGNDRVKLQVNRSLGFFGLEGQMNYGFNTTTLNHAVKKQISESLSCEVATTRGLDSGRSGMSKAEESVRMNYGFKF
jgi:hypothetical protein